MGLTWDDLREDVANLNQAPPHREIAQPSFASPTHTSMAVEVSDEVVCNTVRGIRCGYGVNTCKGRLLATYVPPQEGEHRVGTVIRYFPNLGMYVALYRGFLLKEPQPIPPEVLPMYYSNYVRTHFDRVRGMVKDRMPRVRVLKRLRLQMMTPVILPLLLEDMDVVFAGDEEYKAQVATTPFYVDLGGIIKTYDLSTGEVNDISKEGANYLCWFYAK